MKQLLGRRGLPLLGAAVLVAATGGIAYAAIPDSGKVFTACMLKNVGTVRLIDPSLPSSNLMSHCTSLETQITFNQQGQQGPQGIPGAQGAKGLTGANGAPGTNGTNGLPGAKGADGKDGINGTNGIDGLPGAKGADGKDGINGTNGIDGLPGAKGADGKDGIDGLPGAKGADGKDGIDGTNGVDGLPGPKGADGKDGTNGTNGIDGLPGAAGVTGQGATSLLGTNSLTVDLSTLMTPLPGLTTTVNVPANAFVFLSTTGGAFSNASGPDGLATVLIDVVVDGVVLDGGSRRVEMIGNGSVPNAIAYWSIARTLSLTPGPHTITVRAGGAGFASGVSSSVSAGPLVNNNLRGTLDILTLKQ
jgi:Collagen triple helix repeat (20 copies)